MINIATRGYHVELGERLRITRNNAGITQEVAAQAIQVKRPTLVAIEQGNRRIKPFENRVDLQIRDLLFLKSKFYVSLEAIV